MHVIRNGIILIIMATCCCCKQHKEIQIATRDTAAFRIDWPLIADVMMQRINLEPGEKVLIVAVPGRFDSLISILKVRILLGKGSFYGVFNVDSTPSPEGWETDFIQTAHRLRADSLERFLKGIELAIMMPGATVDDLPYKAMQNVLQSGQGRTIHFHWSGAYTVDGAPMSITPDIERHYQEAIVSTDYRKLSALQQFFEQAARSQGVSVTTPLGTDLRFTLGDRPVTKQDGDASRARTEYARNLIDREIELPAGAIRVAPVESSVEGVIAFPDASWSGQPVTGLVVRIHAGKVTDIKATSGLESVKAELDSAGSAGYSFREFALGFNPLLALPISGEKWIPYYGYGAGIVRLSLGDNTELGGVVSGGYVRWNFFIDATVRIGEREIVRNGKMLE